MQKSKVNRNKAGKPDLSKVGFIKSYLLPALVTFLIPGFALWFFDHVERSYDGKFREAIIAQINADRSLTATKRAKALEFYEKVSVSKILASNKPEAQTLQDQFRNVQTRYAIFRWMKRISVICLATALGASMAVGIGVLLSFRSQAIQYWSLRLAWNILRVFALIQVLGQGVLAVALSFWSPRSGWKNIFSS